MTRGVSKLINPLKKLEDVQMEAERELIKDTTHGMPLQQSPKKLDEATQDVIGDEMSSKFKRKALTPERTRILSQQQTLSDMHTRRRDYKKLIPNRKTFHHRVCILGPGQIFGEECVMFDQNVQYSLKVISESAEVIKLTEIEFKKMLKNQGSNTQSV